MINTWPSHESEPEVRDFFLRILGTGAADPTKVNGNGMVVTRAALGVYEITWKEDPKGYLGIGGFTFEATAPAGPKGYTLTAGVYNPATKKLQVSVWSSAFAAVDLAANQWLSLTIKFKETKV